MKLSPAPMELIVLISNPGWRSIESLINLHNLSKAINSILKVDEVVEIIKEKTAKLMKSPKVIILLLDKSPHTFTGYSSRGFAEGEITVRQLEDIQSFDHCIVHKGIVIHFRELFDKDKYVYYRSLMPALAEMFFAPLEIQGKAYRLLGVTGRPYRKRSGKNSRRTSVDMLLLQKN